MAVQLQDVAFKSILPLGKFRELFFRMLTPGSGVHKLKNYFLFELVYKLTEHKIVLNWCIFLFELVYLNWSAYIS